MLIKAAQFDFNIFNIHCPNLSVLEQLKTLLKNWFPIVLKLIKIVVPNIIWTIQLENF
jgi:hypothetical protein